MQLGVIDFDKRTVKVLKAIYRSKNGISYAKLLNTFQIRGEKKFSKFTDLIYALYEEGYISCDNSRESFSVFEETGCILTISKKAIFLSTSKANEFIQQKNWDLTKWLIPTIISIAALIIAGISLVLQFL